MTKKEVKQIREILMDSSSTNFVTQTISLYDLLKNLDEYFIKKKVK